MGAENEHSNSNLSIQEGFRRWGCPGCPQKRSLNKSQLRNPVHPGMQPYSSMQTIDGRGMDRVGEKDWMFRALNDHT